VISGNTGRINGRLEWDKDAITPDLLQPALGVPLLVCVIEEDLKGLLYGSP
jgi:hypothetical protein